MTKVTVIFSDGSKRMAHNNDDLSLRWHERKAYADELAPPPDRAYIRDCSDIPDLDTALIWREEILAQLFGAQNQLTLLKTQHPTKRTYDRDSYAIQWKIIATQCHLEARRLRKYVKGANILTNPMIPGGSRGPGAKIKRKLHNLLMESIICTLYDLIPDDAIDKIPEEYNYVLDKILQRDNQQEELPHD